MGEFCLEMGPHGTALRLALQPRGEDENGVHRFWGPVKKVRFLRGRDPQSRTLTAELPELPQ